MAEVNAGKIAAEVLIRTESAKKELASLQKLVDLSKKSLEDLTKDALNNSNKGFDEHGKSVDESSKAYRRFFQEQRLQDRIMGEGKQAVMGLASAFSFLAQGQEHESQQMKRIENGLTTFVLAANAGEFALFSLGKMGSSAGGSIGMFASRIQGLAGPIGMIVGIGAGLIAFFEDAEKAASDTKGLDDFKKKLEEISDKMLGIGTKQLREDLAHQLDKIGDIKVKLKIAMTGVDEKGNPDPWKTWAASLNKELIAAQEQEASIIDKLNAANETSLEREKNKKNVFDQQLGIVASLNAKITELTTQRDKEATTEAEVKRLNEEIVKLTERRNRLLETEEQRRQREKDHLEKQLQGENSVLDILELKFKNQEFNTTSSQKNEQIYRQMLETLLDMTTDLKLQEQIKLRIRDLDDKSNDRNKEAEKERLKVTNEIAKEGITDKYAKEREEARQWFEEQKTSIEKLYDNEVERTKKLNDLKTAYQNKLSDITKRSNEEAAQKQEKDLDDLISNIDKVGSALHHALGEAGDDFIQKLLSALQIALQIAKTIDKANASGGMSTGDWISTAADIIGFIGLFDSGGTVPGTKGTPQMAIVHSGETILPTHKYPVGEAFMRAMSRGTPTNGMFDNGGIVGSGYNMNAGVIAELQMLRKSLESQQTQINVVLEGTLSGQKFLKKEMPGYEKFRGNKSA